MATITGTSGNDTLDLTLGTNTVTGGAGNDIFNFIARGTQNHTITDFTPGSDKLDLSFLNVSSIADLMPFMRQDGTDLRIELFWNDSNGSTPNEVIVLQNTDIFSLSASDFIFSTETSDLTVTWSGISGYDFTLFGALGNDTINGGLGDDVLSGGAGNDILRPGSGFNNVYGGLGADTLDITSRGGRTNIFVDFEASQGDRIDLSAFGISSLAQLTPYLRQDGDDLRIELFWNDSNGSSPNEVFILRDTEFTDLSANNFVFFTSAFDLTTTASGINSYDFILFGGNGNDDLTTLGGDDIIDSGAGNDTLAGGSGTNIYRTGTGSDTIDIIGRGSQVQIVEDFDLTSDRVDMREFNVADLATLMPYMRQSGDDVRIELFWNDSNGTSPNEVIILRDVQLSQITAANFRFNTSPFDLTVNASGINSYDFVLFGGNGNDTLSGLLGEDQLNGGAGNDTLIGNGGTNLLRGGSGNDTFVFAGRGGQAQIIADFGTGSDVIDLRAYNVADLESLQPFLSQEGDDVTIRTFWNDTSGRPSPNEAIIIRNMTIDQLTASMFVFNTLTDDLTVSGSGISSYDFTLFGGLGNDTINGINGDDSLVGGAGNDTINGFAGIDAIYGGTGANIIDAGSGNDTIYARLDGQADTIDGGTGTDTVNFLLYQTTAGIVADLSAGTVGEDSVTNVENLVMTDNNDIVTGSAGANSIAGNGGADLIYGLAGADNIQGGDGDDLIFAGADNDIVTGGAGVDQIFGESGADTILGGDGNDFLYGNEGSDRLEGEAGVDYLIGGNGNDTLIGGADTDVLYGEGDNDRLESGDGDDFLFGGDGDDTLIGGAGGDYLLGGSGTNSLFGGDATDVLYSFEGGTDRLEGGGDGDYYLIYDSTFDAGGSVTIFESASAAGQDQVYFYNSGLSRSYSMASNIEFGFLVSTVAGTSGLTLTGSSSSESLYILGSANFATLDGGGGNDVLFGSVGNDQLFGGSGNDNLIASLGDDILNGGFGNDVLFGEAGNDTLYTTDGTDFLYTGTGNDIVVWVAQSGLDGVVDFQNGADRIDVSGIANGVLDFSDLSIVQQGADVVLTLNNFQLYLYATNAADLDATDFIF